jgi:hypothetical protein
MQLRKYSEDYSKHSMDFRTRCWNLEAVEALEDTFRSTRRLQDSTMKSSGLVRPGAAGLLTGVEYSKVRDSAWMYLASLVTTRTTIGLVDLQGNYSTSLE